MPDMTAKLLVIGAGPGGYVAAIRAGQLGVPTIIVEQAALGGTCLNVGCIPSKALIHAADEFHKLRRPQGLSSLGISVGESAIDPARTSKWIGSIVERLQGGVGHLLDKAGVQVVRGEARFRDGKTVLVNTPEGEQRIRAENIIIATGSEPVELPVLPFGGDILSSTQALAIANIPRRMVVVGGGYIGLEIGTAYAKLGSEVVVVEQQPGLLPQFDAAMVAPVAASLKRLGIKVMTSTAAKGWADGVLTVESRDAGETSIPADKVLVAAGRRPRTACLAGLHLTMSGPFVAIDDRCRTSMRGVYAIGDVTGEPMLAHRAMAQGEMVANAVAGRKAGWDKAAIPAVCFTDPEVVSAGLGPAEIAAMGIESVEGRFSFKANARAMTIERDDGFVRVLARKDNGLILGCQAVGVNVSELSSAFMLALEMGARLEDVAETIHAHPTVSEAFHEACLKALGLPIHIQ
ncbi:MAG: dihydrolipoyl dehydrogenase [Hyphomicrobiaceae bacterium]